METVIAFAALKTKLQALGPLHPEAWEKIVQSCQQNIMMPNEDFMHREGMLTYIADGLLKEYDNQNRKSPAIINFIGSNQVLITRKHNQAHYLKACIPTFIFYWDFENLQNLYFNHKELKQIYDSLCASYDYNIAFGRLILEQKSASDRVRLLITQHRASLPFISKKDLSNYVGLNYDYFTLLFSKLM